MTRKSALVWALAAGACAAPVALALTSVAANAQTVVQQYQPAGVLSLNAQASADIPQDVVDITLFYEQEASDPSSLTGTLNQHADQALQKAKGVSGVTARTGSFSIYPSTDRDGKISAWRGRTEVVLESRDFAAASKLAGGDSVRWKRRAGVVVALLGGAAIGVALDKAVSWGGLAFTSLVTVFVIAAAVALLRREPIVLE